MKHPGEFDSQAISLQSLKDPGFDVSCAVSSPWNLGYCLGSDDGRVQLASVDGTPSIDPVTVAPSGEAINGITFSGNMMAVSTRNEVAFWHHTLSSRGRDERAVRPGGTHGVVEINGGFVAPMGRSGLLLMGPKRANTQTVSVLKPSDGPLNFYRVVTLESPDLGEVVACASR